MPLVRNPATGQTSNVGGPVGPGMAQPFAGRSMMRGAGRTVKRTMGRRSSR